MATFPFLSKSKPDDPQTEEIAVKRQPKTFTMDDIADEVAPEFPDHSPEEIREAMRLISHKIIDTLLSGKDIVFPDGTVYSLDVDGRTILVSLPQDKA